MNIRLFIELMLILLIALNSGLNKIENTFFFNLKIYIFKQVCKLPGSNFDEYLTWFL